MLRRLVAYVAAAALLAACSGRTDQLSPMLPAVANGAGSPHAGANGTGVLEMRVKLAKTAARAHYVSPATRGLTVDITGPTNVKSTAGLTVNSNGCHSTLMNVECDLKIAGLTACPTRKNCYTGSVATYDRINPAKTAIPPSAHELSAAQNFGFWVGTGTTTYVPFILDGIVKTVAFLPSESSSLAGSQSAGFTLPKCNPGIQKVSVLGVDADGNYILGAGAPAVSLVSNTPLQLTVAKRNLELPNTFILYPPRPPAYPYGGHTVVLTAKATPLAKSGAAPVSAAVHVTFSTDICGAFSEFTIPTAGSAPYGITKGPNGNLWFTEAGSGKVGEITTTGAITEFSVPTAASAPAGITTGPDGNLWFVEAMASKVAKMSTSGVAVEFATTTANAGPVQITTGPDGNLWFSESNANDIGRITTGGIVTEFPVLTAASDPYGIASGPDGNLWFVELDGNNVGRITPAGTVSEYPISTAASHPSDIAAGPDGALWFVECTGNIVGRITTSGDITSQYPTPDISPTLPVFDALGPDGKIWFSEAGVNKIGSITTGGAFTELAIPSVGATPFMITTGPDGAVWFVEEGTGKIARLW